MDKSALRQHYRAARQSLPPAQRAQAEAAIAARLDAWLRAYPDMLVGGYHAMRDEVAIPPSPRYLLPRVGDAGLTYHAWQPGESLEAGRYGQQEPPASAPQADPAILLVPLLAFDRRGHRLGYGGGYYDRVIADLRRRGVLKQAVGVAFALQEAPALPDEAHDQLLDAVVTEDELIRFSSQ